MLTPRSDDPNREAELERAKREPETFGLISMDIDGFRRYGKDRHVLPSNFIEVFEPGKGQRPRPSELILPEGVKK